MQLPRRRRPGTTAALALSLALAVGCGSSAGSKTPVQPVDGALDHAAALDAAADGHHDALAADAVVVGHCCVMQLGDASTALCQALSMDAAPGLAEACLPQNTHGVYGRWTCGVGGDPPVCSNNGLSCAVGDPCTLVDVACPGVVQTCDFKPVTPLSG